VTRVSFVLPNLGGGGAEKVTLTLAQEFLAEGHEVDLVTLQASGELLDAIPSGAQLFDLGVKRIRQALWPLWKYFRERRPAAVHGAMWPLTIMVIIAARLSTRPRVVVSDHSILSMQYGGSRTVMAALRWTMRLFYPLADARVGVSQGCVRDLSRISGISEARFDTIANPVAIPQTGIIASSDAELLWGKAGRRILTVGKLKKAKNHALLIRAFARLPKSLNAKLVIMGEGELRPRLQRLIDDLGLTDSIILPGFTGDPWPYYASADLFVLSSNREGFPLVLIEAMLAGARIVSTNCGNGFAEILMDGQLGTLVPTDDATALAQAMLTALSNPHDPKPGRQHAARLCRESSDRYFELMLPESR